MGSSSMTSRRRVMRAATGIGAVTGLALTGLVALATLTAGTTPGEADLAIGHPGGTSSIGLRTRPDGCRVVVVADRRIIRLAELPLEA